MLERAEQIMGQELPEYRQDLPEVELPSQPSDPERNPRVAEDLATLEARQTVGADESVEIDLTIGVGEDPGWQRAVRARRWKDREPGSVRSREHGA